MCESTYVNTNGNDLLVGENGCTIEKIVEIMMNDSVKLHESQLSYLMIQLEITYHDRENILRTYYRSEVTIYDLMERILIVWRQRASTEATLSNFIWHLRCCRLNHTADKLGHYFYQHQISPSNQYYPYGANALTHAVTKPSEDWQIPPVPDGRPLLKPKFNLSVHCEDTAKYHYRAGEYAEKKSNYNNRPCALLVLILFLISPLLIYFVMRMPNENAKVHHSNDTHNKTWLTQPIILGGRNATELSIKTHHELNEFFDPVNYWGNLASVEFDDTLGLICQGNTAINLLKKQSLSRKVNSPRLRQLVLNFPSSCEVLIDRILANFNANQFDVFVFKGEVNDDNIYQIHEILHRNVRSLEEIKISGVLRSSVNIFEVRNNVVLDFVKTITLNFDQYSYTGVNRGIINDRFCSHFPQLEKIETKNIFISLSEVFRLDACLKLKHLNTIIKVGRNDIKRIGELNWKVRFPSLTSFAIKLEFDTCPGFAYFENLIKNAEIFQKYKLCSNCNMSSKRRALCHMKSIPG